MTLDEYRRRELAGVIQPFMEVLVELNGAVLGNFTPDGFTGKFVTEQWFLCAYGGLVDDVIFCYNALREYMFVHFGWAPTLTANQLTVETPTKFDLGRVWEINKVGMLAMSGLAILSLDALSGDKTYEQLCSLFTDVVTVMRKWALLFEDKQSH